MPKLNFSGNMKKPHLRCIIKHTNDVLFEIYYTVFWLTEYQEMCSLIQSYKT